MGSIKRPSAKILKLNALSLLARAEEVLLESASRATGFDDAADFKKALIADLDEHRPFGKAVADFHEQYSKLVPAPRPVSKDLAKKAGRVQAARFDPSLGQKDRRRGKRVAGGKRVGQGQSRKK